MKKHWIDDLRNRLGHYETEAPEGVWSSISERLYGAAAPMDGHLNVALKQRKQAATIWLIPTGIAATIALLALLSYPFLHHEANPANPANSGARGARRPAADHGARGDRTPHVPAEQ